MLFCRSGVALFQPLQEYILLQNTRYSDRVCWAWKPCCSDCYVAQLPVDDGTGFLTVNQTCNKLSAAARPLSQYLLVDGSKTRDRDNIWVDCTTCKDDEYQVCSAAFFFSTVFFTHHQKKQVSQCTQTSDAVCKRYTSCDSRYEYVLRKGNDFNDNLCAPKTSCTASSGRSMFEKAPAVDSVQFTVNGTDAVCQAYSK